MSAVTDEVQQEVNDLPYIVETKYEGGKYVNEMPDIPSLAKDGKDGKEFRIQNKYVLLTYSNVHIPKEWFKFEFIKKRVKWDVEQCEIAHENGSSKFGGYKHTHVYLVSKTKFDNRDARILDLSSTTDIDILRYVDEDGTEKIANGHPNIRVPKTAAHRKNILKYLGKEDPENAHLLVEELTPVEKVWLAPNAREAVRNVTRLSDVMAASAAFKMKPAEYKNMIQLLFPWQISLLETILAMTMDPRAVYWFFDLIGNSGKSMFAKYMMQNYPDDFRMMTSLGTEKDALHVLAGFVDSGWTGKYLWIDLARAYKDRRTVYTIMETVKNAVFTDTKYQGGSYVTSYTPHVFVSANFLPDIKLMSLDRWNIYEMTGERPNFCLRAMPLKECFERRKIVSAERRAKERIKKLEKDLEEKLAIADFYASRNITVDRFGRPVIPQSSVPIDYGSSSSALPTSSAPPAEWGFRTDFSKQE